MDKVVAIYTDGGVIGANGTGGSPDGGTWAWCGVDVYGNRIIEKSGVLKPDSRYDEIATGVTNNHTEFFAVCKALYALPDKWQGQLYTDSMVVYSRLFRYKHNRRKPMKNTPLRWQEWFYKHLDRLGNIEIFHVKGHSGDTHNEWCDKECNRLKKAA